jgi:isopropylmalate/homocitrate/citramalate synthase
MTKVNEEGRKQIQFKEINLNLDRHTLSGLVRRFSNLGQDNKNQEVKDSRLEEEIEINRHLVQSSKVHLATCSFC